MLTKPPFPSLLIALIIACFIAPLSAEKESYTSSGRTYYRPARIQSSQLEGFDKLPEATQKIINTALATARDNSWLKYKFGGATPAAGGFDCSGAMYYVLKKSGYRPRRTSAQQYLWLRDAGKITHTPDQPQSLSDKVFSKLRPGDLLFWSGTYQPTDGRKVKITHVAMYLGKEKDGRQVMISSTKGRSYRGKRGDGYGVYDFKLPSKTSKARLVGYGSVPTPASPKQ